MNMTKYVTEYPITGIASKARHGRNRPLVNRRKT
jgi:hypothetical protein